MINDRYREPSNLESYLDPPDWDSLPVCPICGSEYQVCFSKDGEIIGCEHCVTEIYYDDELDAERYNLYDK